MDIPPKPGHSLQTLLLGPLPLVNHFLARLRIDSILARRVPGPDTADLSFATDLGVLLRNLLLAREPLYGLSTWAAEFRPDLVGLSPDTVPLLNDDRLGRSLDALFDADRASLATEIVVRAVQEFHISLERFHNDSTTVTLQGAYREATGEPRRGKATVKAIWGHNKDHRPDLKQLLWILTVSADGAVPVHYRVADGNTNDSPTHRESWEALRSLKGSPDFLYVADSKLCDGDTLRAIAGKGGRFLTVLPRSRKEDGLFREYVVTHELAWEEVLRRSNPRNQMGPEDVWKMVESPIPAADGFRLVWAWNSLMAEEDRESREGRMAQALARLEDLEKRLQSPKTKIRTRGGAIQAAERAAGNAGRWVKWTVEEEKVSVYRQEHRGRPGKETRYRRKVRTRFHVVTHLNEPTIAYDAKSDGMFPLLTNERKSPLKEVLEYYHFQPRLEKRHEQLKTVHEVAPVLLKKIERVEALLFVYFLALLVEALIEREVRNSMSREERKSIPLYPEGRPCAAPTTQKILEAFDRIEVHQLWEGGKVAEVFLTNLTEVQREILRLAGVPEAAYSP